MSNRIESGTASARTIANTAGPPSQPTFDVALIRPFTLSPSHRGGRVARRGFEFQDWWTAYMLIGLLSELEDVAYAMIEGVEDVDLILREGDLWVERYCQIKSKKEGARSWTISTLEKEGVFSRFFRLFRDFRESPHEEKRRIEFFLILEGDLAQEIQELGTSVDSRGRRVLYAALLANEVLSRRPEYRDAYLLLQRHDLFWNTSRLNYSFVF